MKNPETDNNKISLGKILRRTCAILAVIAAAVVAVFVFGDICPIYRTFRFPCPGCGMTRAWVSVLKGDIGAAAEYHPLWWAVPALAGAVAVYILDKNASRKRRRTEEVILILLCVMFIACYLWRIIFQGWRG